MDEKQQEIIEKIREALKLYYQKNQDNGADEYALLKNKTVLNSYLKDLIKNYSDQKILNNAVSNDIGGILYEAIGQGTTEQNAAFHRAVLLLTEDGFDQRKSADTVLLFTKALGWDISPEQNSIAPSYTNNHSVQPDSVKPSPVLSTSDAKTNTDMRPIILSQSSNHAVAPKPAVAVVQQSPNVIQNDSIVQENKPKKSKAVVPLLFIILVLLAILFVFAMQWKKQHSNPDPLLNNNNTNLAATPGQVTSVINENLITPQTETAASESSDVNVAALQTIPSESELSETSAETAANLAKYSIRTLTSAVDTKGINIHSFCVNSKKDVLYYTENDVIYQIDLNTGSQNMVVDLKTQEEKESTQIMPQVFHNIKLLYNPYDQQCYAIAKINQKNCLMNLDTQEVYDVMDFAGSYYAFSGADTLCMVSCSDGADWFNHSKELNFRSNTIKEGFVYKDHTGNNNESFLFLHNDDYYWLNVRMSGLNDLDKRKFYLNSPRTSMCADIDSTKITPSYGDIEGCARAVYNDQAYIMKPDFSIYKIDVDKLRMISEDIANHSDYDVFSQNEFSSCEDALELFIARDDIKQTGKESLNKVNDFGITDSGKVVVFDRFDSAYKVIEPS